MHPNFYHWHARVALELKPETAILEPRWNAAAKFAEKLSPSDVCSLLRLVLLGAVDADFAKRFTDFLVKAEPTYPPDIKPELLRVMATAAIESRLEKSSGVADALSLGLQAASFPERRVDTITPDIMVRASEYIVKESEEMRPQIDVGALEKAEKQTEGYCAVLKKAVATNDLQQIGKATEDLNRGVVAAVKESHERLGLVINRLTEESQFLWWLIGQRSPARNLRRSQLTAEEYAFVAAHEAAERVAFLPPASSVASLIEEVFEQCHKNGHARTSLIELIESADADWVNRNITPPTAPDLTPVAALLATRLQNGKLEAEALKKLGVSTKTKITPNEGAQQYFRELMFLEALANLG